MEDDKARGTAYHEAGHAVAAHVLGRGIEHVSIAATEDADGHVSTRSRGDSWLTRLEEAQYDCSHGAFIDGRLRRSVETEIMVLLAGGCSEMKATRASEHEVGTGLVKLSEAQTSEMAEKFGGGADRWGSLLIEGDLKLALFLACQVSGSDDEGSAYLDWLEQRTLNLLGYDVWWAAVEGLADGLLVEPTMSGRRTREVIQGAIAAHLAPNSERLMRVLGSSEAVHRG